SPVACEGAAGRSHRCCHAATTAATQGHARDFSQAHTLGGEHRMANGDESNENEGMGGGSFVMGLLTGAVLGAGLGMLSAPKAGSDLRGQLSEQASNLANSAS